MHRAPRRPRGVFATTRRPRLVTLGGFALLRLVTEATCQLIQDHFICEPRGEIQVKGNGMMPTHLLRGRLA